MAVIAEMSVARFRLLHPNRPTYKMGQPKSEGMKHLSRSKEFPGGGRLDAVRSPDVSRRGAARFTEVFRRVPLDTQKTIIDELF